MNLMKLVWNYLRIKFIQTCISNHRRDENVQGFWSEAERGGWHGFRIPKERISHRHDRPNAAFPTLLYACIIYRWRNECYVFGTVLIDEETITAYREQDASLVMICVICRARRTYAITEAMMKREDMMIYRLEIKRSYLEIGVEIIKIVYIKIIYFNIFSFFFFENFQPPLNRNRLR